MHGGDPALGPHGLPLTRVPVGADVALLGEIFDLPIPQPHCSANMGMRMKVTCSISGAKIK